MEKIKTDLHEIKGSDNRTILKAIVIRGKTDEIQKDRSNQLDAMQDEFNSVLKGDRFIEPPFEPMLLSLLPENSSELIQVIEAMEVNIEGFGQRVIRREMTDEQAKRFETDIKKEQMDLKGLLEIPNPDDDLTSLRRKTRKDIETLGYGFWEILTGVFSDDDLVGLNYIEGRNVRLTKLDDDFTEVKKKFLDEHFDWQTKTFFKKFRRYIQVVGNKKVYFKEWDDPRFISKFDGEVIEKPTSNDRNKKQANGLMHFKIHSGRTPYGMPRIVGNLFSVFGSRAADVINFQTFKNNNVPSMVVSVSNGMLTQGSIDRIEEFMSSTIKRSDNYSKFLILEAETQDEDVQNAGAMKIDIKPLTEHQRTDQLFQEYDKNNSNKIDRAFRLPGLFVGKTEALNRATADAARRVADEQVFSPERQEIDRQMNRMLIHFGFKYHFIKSNSPNVTDEMALTKVMSGGEKAGGFTPNIAREVIAEILNKDLPIIEKTENFDPNVPFSLTMAEAVKKRDGLAPNQGQLSGGDDTEKSVRDFFEYMENPAGTIDDDIDVGVFTDDDEGDE